MKLDPELDQYMIPLSECEVGSYVYKYSSESCSHGRYRVKYKYLDGSVSIGESTTYLVVHAKHVDVVPIEPPDTEMPEGTLVITESREVAVHMVVKSDGDYRSLQRNGQSRLQSKSWPCHVIDLKAVARVKNPCRLPERLEGATVLAATRPVNSFFYTPTASGFWQVMDRNENIVHARLADTEGAWRVFDGKLPVVPLTPPRRLGQLEFETRVMVLNEQDAGPYILKSCKGSSVHHLVSIHDETTTLDLHGWTVVGPLDLDVLRARARELLTLSADVEPPKTWTRLPLPPEKEPETKWAESMETVLTELEIALAAMSDGAPEALYHRVRFTLGKLNQRSPLAAGIIVETTRLLRVIHEESGSQGSALGTPQDFAAVARLVYRRTEAQRRLEQRLQEINGG